jgi:hypothetical protein
MWLDRLILAMGVLCAVALLATYGAINSPVYGDPMEVTHAQN